MKRELEMKDDCPACAAMGAGVKSSPEKGGRTLSNWPLQIKLIGSMAPFLNDAELLVAADCTAFATPDFHEKFLGDNKVLIGCPKLDGAPLYVEKFAELFRSHSVRKVTCLRMEVPCCGGLTMILREAIKQSGKDIPLTETIIGIKGGVLAERPVDYL
jgi:hypothetical protein